MLDDAAAEVGVHQDGGGVTEVVAGGDGDAKSRSRAAALEHPYSQFGGKFACFGKDEATGMRMEILVVFF